MRQFYLHKRGAIYYAELVDRSTGRKLPARSTGERNEAEARDVVRGWLRDGLPSSPTRPARPVQSAFTVESILAAVRSEELSPADAERIAFALKARGLILSYTTPGSSGAEFFTDFLTRFWNYEKSPYIAEKLAHGQHETKEHVKHSLQRCRVHWFPYFRGKRLAELTKGDLKAFSVSLAEDEKKLAPATRNRILVSGIVALRWAYANSLIAEDVTLGLIGFSGTGRKRGVLTPEEAALLFRLDWNDERARVGNMVAATTGLRLGEIRALKAENIGDNVLLVSHAYTDGDGIKTPKNGETRRVPLLPEIRDELNKLLKANPHGEDGFIFFDPLDADKPCPLVTLTHNLRSMLIFLKIGDADATKEKKDEARKYWADRNVVFHSWRHFYSARMADHVAARTLMLATGHKTKSIFESYAEHALDDELAKVAKVAGEVFEDIIPK